MRILQGLEAIGNEGDMKHLIWFLASPAWVALGLIGFLAGCCWLFLRGGFEAADKIRDFQP